MTLHPRRPTAKHILPFPEWVEQQFPEKTALRAVLKLVGILDVAYLAYRLHTKTPVTQSQEATKALAAPTMPLVIEQHATTLTQPADAPEHTTMKQVMETEEQPISKKKKRNIAGTKKPRTKKKMPMKEQDSSEIALEFSSDDIPQPVHSTAQNTIVAEPEALDLQNDVPAPKSNANCLWLDDAAMEDVDLLKTPHAVMHVDGTPVSLETRDVDDERETLLCIGDKTFTVKTLTPPLHVSRMVQTAKVSYGELYVLVRAALGAISGEGYVSADEAKRIVQALESSADSTLNLEVTYCTKNSTSRIRQPDTIMLHFERVR